MGPPLRSFDIATDDNGSFVEVAISETPGLKAENLSLATWGSSFVLANLLHKWKSTVQHSTAAPIRADYNAIPVLELGAGTSLVGISAAAVWQVQGVITTDLAPLIRGLAQNISVNANLLKDRSASVSCGTLDWSEPDSLHVAGEHARVVDAKQTKAQIILAADTVYAEDHPELLTKTITAWLAPGPDSRVIFCYVLRHSYIDIIRDLWEQLDAVGLECIEEGQKDADPDKWDDVAPFEWCVWRWKGEAVGAEHGAR
ncbi:Methyltransferase [Fulvia fulva]|uniref:Methyltransferase n=1 Tax=Passalora fulva TaxID=5499 RepID=A0A9Q8P8X5_PASFU|nr:Methyltransferase [Fulvia fulva]KAK4623897.1 Methyltransferase [Fulvia fulva]KAK4625954.1 Methyltransferase [Fulvia fulva]UJO17669.1 Methyltransferase [Fulvia fulva]WPV15178.1 Methyltransferase [Fulvia fulva]WPV30131.1 Methyltransferase [Fulvia fulva]